eukprot:CAMPEP_0119406788 /NCGR_PEP_ID=MMETSP1335-20130426/983_1 /TAXON_ID=259385 /ORGANISM="Chrysoculter rhomboideus, Strain RCC1486" /LENGTH=242 /DNA_ID=CAMNT_0007430881 /DNA_START=76 /DNA_END=803 /DNA_ORIENTATION=+
MPSAALAGSDTQSPAWVNPSKQAQARAAVHMEIQAAPGRGFDMFGGEAVTGLMRAAAARQCLAGHDGDLLTSALLLLDLVDIHGLDRDAQHLHARKLGHIAAVEVVLNHDMQRLNTLELHKLYCTVATPSVKSDGESSKACVGGKDSTSSKVMLTLFVNSLILLGAAVEPEMTKECSFTGCMKGILSRSCSSQSLLSGTSLTPPLSTFGSSSGFAALSTSTPVVSMHDANDSMSTAFDIPRA